MENEKLYSLKWGEARRLRALDLKAKGWPLSTIAEAFGVSKAAVSKWFKNARRKGRKSLYTQHRFGAPTKISESQRRLIPDLLWHGAEAYGFRGQLWTCRRVAKVIEQEFGVVYHPAHVSRLLKELGWTPQKPITTASQRDNAEIQYWLRRMWPMFKKKPGAKDGR